MTPADKTKFKSFAQVRTLVLNPEIKEKLIDSEYYIEGYAATFERYLLFKAEDGEDVFEMFERNCFDNADMSDIVLHLNHGGHVFARTSNGTLIVQVREHGLFFAADLSKTESGRKMYEEIKTGMITKCSWMFRPREYFYDAPTRTIVHRSVEKVYDVSPVTFPANEGTEVEAKCRSFADGVIGENARREAEKVNAELREKIKIKIKINKGE